MGSKGTDIKSYATWKASTIKGTINGEGPDCSEELVADLLQGWMLWVSPPAMVASEKTSSLSRVATHSQAPVIAEGSYSLLAAISCASFWALVKGPGAGRALRPTC